MISSLGRALNRTSKLAITMLFVCIVPLSSPLQAETKGEKIGREAYEKLNSEARYPDEELQAYVTKLGNYMVSHSEMADEEWTFTVINDESLNAFVTEGRFVYIHTGLLMYMQSEAQLAGVIGHEIGHLVHRHPQKRQSSASLGKALSNIATVAVAVATGSGQAARSTSQLGGLANTALVTGYGRDNELESDAAGARYLLAAGYPPQAMIDGISAMKDQERFQRLKAKEAGVKLAGYHALSSTHPRNDRRLQEVIRAVGQLEEGQVRRGLDGEFERQLEGLKFRDNPLITRTNGSRYLNRPMDFTLAYPSGWKIKSRGSVIQARGPSDGAVVQMRVKKLKEDITPENYLRVARNFTDLTDGQTLDTETIKGYAGRIPESAKYPERRVAVMFHKKRAFLFVAQVERGKQNAFYDSLFSATFASFRPLTDYEKAIALSRQITWQQVPAGTTFAALAEQSPIKQFAEEELRLMNGRYPYGEPKPGEWLKVVR
ncbi:MAG: M48 family metalloprotease [Pseudomonadales bacterium]